MPTLPDPSAEPPSGAAPVLLPRWVQLVLLPLAVLGVVAIMRAAGPVLLLFIVAGLIALLLNPSVTVLRRLRFPRGMAVLAVMLCVVLLVVGIGVLLANPVSDQVSAFQRNVPDIVDDANASLADFQGWLDRNDIDLQVKEEGSTALQTLGSNLSEGSGELVSFTSDALQILVEASIALILVIVLCVYMLLYGERIGQGVRAVVPRGDGTPEDDFPTRIQAAVFGYVRGQVLFSLIMGTSAGVMLWILGSLGIFPQGKTYALFFGAWYGFAELIPYVGPAIGAFPPVMIALFSGEPLDAVWLAIAFTALQQIEGHIVAPTVFSQALRINPLLVIFALLLGGQLYGFLGAFIALPIAAILRETTVYLRRHIKFEPWDLPAVRPAGPGFGSEPSGVGSGMPAAGASRGMASGARAAGVDATAASARAGGGATPAEAGGPTVETGGRPEATLDDETGDRTEATVGSDDGAGSRAEATVGSDEEAGGRTEATVGSDDQIGGRPAVPAAPVDAGLATAPAHAGEEAGARGGVETPACPECGAPREPGSVTCPKCGTELGGADETTSATASAPQ